MSSFSQAHKFTSLWEGGFVDHASDPGGATNYGVSLRWLKEIGFDVNGDGDIDQNDIRALTPEAAQRLFLTHFWNASNLSVLPQRIATAVYDANVNMGIRQSIIFLQSACNTFVGPRLLVDGIPGSRTAARVNDICRAGSELKLCQKTLEFRKEYYLRLSSREPYKNKAGKTIHYRPFLQGWLNRISALWDYITREIK